MARSQNAFNKQQREKKKLQKKKAKQQKKEERRANSPGGDLDNMMAYLDENGNIIDTPPDQQPTKPNRTPGKEIEEKAPDLDSERRGKVVYFSSDKGTGTILQDHSNERFKVFDDGLKVRVQEGDTVRFNLKEEEDQHIAINVRKVG